MSLNLSLGHIGPDIEFLEMQHQSYMLIDCFILSFSELIPQKDQLTKNLFGDEVEQVSREALQRRYRLLPYLYTLFRESSVSGMPVMRPLFFHDSKAHYLRTEQENFLLGGDLLIIPKWSENGAIPEGNWRDVSIIGENSKTHKYHPDIKIRPGSIVPLCNNIQSTTSFSLIQLLY